jgi:hypothetical protein
MSDNLTFLDMYEDGHEHHFSGVDNNKFCLDGVTYKAIGIGDDYDVVEELARPITGLPFDVVRIGGESTDDFYGYVIYSMDDGFVYLRFGIMNGNFWYKGYTRGDINVV